MAFIDTSNAILTGKELPIEVNRLMTAGMEKIVNSDSRVELGGGLIDPSYAPPVESKLRLASQSSPSPGDVHVDTFMTRMFLVKVPSNYYSRQALNVQSVRRDRGEYSFLDSALARQSVQDYARSVPGQPAPTVDVQYGEAEYKTTAYALRAIIPDKVIDNADLPIRPYIDALLVLRSYMMGLEDQITGTLLNTSTNYGTVVSTADVLTGSDANIRDVIHDYQNQVEDKSTKRPTRLICNENTLRKLAFSDSAKRDKDTNYSFARSVANLRELCGLSKIVEYKSSHNTAAQNLDPAEADKGKTTLSLTKNFPDDKVALIASDTNLMRNNTWGLIFARQQRNMLVKRYRQEELSSEVVEIQSEYVPEIIDEDAGVFFSNA